MLDNTLPDNPTDDEQPVDLRCMLVSHVPVNKEPPNPNTTQIGGDHYKNMGVEPWNVVDTWPIEQQIGAHRLQVLKYVMRMGNKPNNAGVLELKKARHCLDKLISVIEGGQDDRN